MSWDICDLTLTCLLIFQHILRYPRPNPFMLTYLPAYPVIFNYLHAYLISSTSWNICDLTLNAYLFSSISWDICDLTLLCLLIFQHILRYLWSNPCMFAHYPAQQDQVPVLIWQPRGLYYIKLGILIVHWFHGKLGCLSKSVKVTSSNKKACYTIWPFSVHLFCNTGPRCHSLSLHHGSGIDIKSLQNRLLKVCYVPATIAGLNRLLLFYFHINSSNKASKAGSTCY